MVMTLKITKLICIQGHATEVKGPVANYYSSEPDSLQTAATYADPSLRVFN